MNKFRNLYQELEQNTTPKNLKNQEDDFFILDPGFGQGHYAKSLADNCFILHNLAELRDHGFPILVGWSRKSMVADLSNGAAVNDRLPGSLAAAIVATQNGASFLRVHDVASTRQALSVLQGVESMGYRS